MARDTVHRQPVQQSPGRLRKPCPAEHMHDSVDGHTWLAPQLVHHFLSTEVVPVLAEPKFVVADPSTEYSCVSSRSYQNHHVVACLPCLVC